MIEATPETSEGHIVRGVGAKIIRWWREPDRIRPYPVQVGRKPTPAGSAPASQHAANRGHHPKRPVAQRKSGAFTQRGSEVRFLAGRPCGWVPGPLIRTPVSQSQKGKSGVA